MEAFCLRFGQNALRFAVCFAAKSLRFFQLLINYQLKYQLNFFTNLIEILSLNLQSSFGEAWPSCTAGVKFSSLKIRCDELLDIFVQVYFNEINLKFGISLGYVSQCEFIISILDDDISIF